MSGTPAPLKAVERGSRGPWRLALQSAAVRSKYPLEALEALREREVDAQAARVAERLRATTEAERIEQAARERRAGAEQVLERERASELGRLAAGGVRAG